MDSREMFEKLPDGVTLHDATDGTLLDTNHQFCEMLGYSREELLELDFDALHVDEPPYTSERAERYIRKAATEGPQTFEWVDETKDGERVPVEVHLRQTTIDDEQRILAVVRDITERKERERELERHNQRLNRFTSVVSHDLRSPLTVAISRLELAQEECESAHLAPAEAALERCQTLIDDLLRLAREGEQVDDLDPVEFADLCHACWVTVNTGEAGITVDIDRTVMADRSRLHQLLENLFRNAIDHGDEDVMVTVGEIDGGFYVEDDGPGIPADEREAVFEVGYSTAEDGAGFGLSIVNEVAEAHGWEITATEGSDGGARFEITGVEFIS